MGINALLAALVLIPTAFVAMLPGEFGVMFLAASQRTYYLAHRYRVPVLAGAYVLFGLLCIRAAAGETSAVWLWVTGIGLAINSLMLLLAYPPNVFRSITEPQYMDAVHADRVLSPDDEVVGLTEGGPARAYALDTIIRPHAVIDRLGTVPLFVSWCSLSNTGIAFQGDSVLNLRPLTAINHNIAFYDPDTKNLIQQIGARVVCGPDCGKRLQTVPILVSRWNVSPNCRSSDLLLRSTGLPLSSL